LTDKVKNSTKILRSNYEGLVKITVIADYQIDIP